MRISGLLFGRHVRGFIQKAEITDDGGQRCFQIMGKIGNQVILTGSFLLQNLLVPEHLGFDLHDLRRNSCIFFRKNIGDIIILGHTKADHITGFVQRRLFLP